MPKIKLQIQILTSEKPQLSAANRTNGDGASGMKQFAGEKRLRTFVGKRHTANKRGYGATNPSHIRNRSGKALDAFLTAKQIRQATDPSNVQFHSRYSTAD